MGEKRRQNLTTFLSIAQSRNMQFRPSHLHHRNVYSFKLLSVPLKQVSMAKSQTNKIHIQKTTKYNGTSLRYARIQEANRTH